LRFSCSLDGRSTLKPFANYAKKLQETCHETPSQRILPNPQIPFLLWAGDPSQAQLIKLGVQRVEDPHHPRGYRELRSPAEMRKLLNRKVRQQAGICAICHEEFTHYNDIVPDHKNPKGMGGAWRDDHPDNIQATHWWCNEEKGSARIDD
jgi:hypothetical protein